MPRVKKVMQFTRPECGRVRSEIQKALNEVGNKLGINISLGNGRFSSESFGMKLECTLGTENLASLQDQAKKQFGLYAKSFGLKASDFGRSFSDFRGKRWEIVGIKPQSHRYPILCKNLNGKTYKLPLDEVVEGLKAEA